MENTHVREMDKRIREMRRLSEELKEIGKGNPSVERNVIRILACVKMLELNICDASALM